MTLILLTNDDGVDAPGLPAFATGLAALGEVAVVVPHVERSWVGKAITRFDPIEVHRLEVSGVEMRTATGFPADCVQLGIHALFGRRPDIVVSGINLGYNHGSAYLQSSGTVGAILEAAIADVPGIAFSTGVAHRPWSEFRPWAAGPDAKEMWERLADVASAMVADYLAAGPAGALSVGLPGGATLDTERRVTRVADAGYDRLFDEIEPGVYRHAFGGLARTEDDTGGTDIEAAFDEVIAITPVRGAGTDGGGVEIARALAARHPAPGSA